MTTNHRLEEAVIFCALRTRKYNGNGGTVSRRGTLGGSWLFAQAGKWAWVAHQSRCPHRPTAHTRTGARSNMYEHVLERSQTSGVLRALEERLELGASSGLGRS